MRAIDFAGVALLAAGLAGCSAAGDGTEDLTVSATAAAMEASDAGDMLGAAGGGFAGGGGTMMGLHCDPDPEITSVELCGRSFPATAHYEWTGCADRPQASSGSVDVTTTVRAEPEGSCDSGATLHVERAVTFATERTRRDGGTVAVSGSTASTSEHAPAATSWVLGRTLDVTRVRAGDGSSSEVHTSGTLEVAVDASTLPPTRTFDGTLEVERDGEGPATVTLTDVVRTSDCYAPVSGTVVRVMADGSEHTLVYGPACGEATLDGEPITVYPYRGRHRRFGG